MFAYIIARVDYATKETEPNQNKKASHSDIITESESIGVWVLVKAVASPARAPMNDRRLRLVPRGQPPTSGSVLNCAID